MALGSTQPLVKMGTRNIPVDNAGGRTARKIDLTKLIVATRNFANARCRHKICSRLQLNVLSLSHDHSSVNITVHSVCVVVELRVIVNYVKILSVAQQCLYAKFMSPATMHYILTNFLEELHSSYFALLPYFIYKLCNGTNGLL
jgi:hypothetical protein